MATKPTTKKADSPPTFHLPTPAEQRMLISRAIRKVTDEAPSLEKSEKNTFGKYNYTPIDAYYEGIASLAARHGLHWTLKQHSVKFVDGPPDDRGKITTYAKWDFTVSVTFDMEVGAQSLYAEWSDYDVSTVYLPHSAGQGTGIARSFAEKAWMRQTFKMVTGEADADDQANTMRPPQQSNQPTMTADDVRELDKVRVEQLKTALNEASSPDQVDQAMANAGSWVPGLKSRDQKAWKEINDLSKLRYRITSNETQGESE